MTKLPQFAPGAGRLSFDEHMSRLDQGMSELRAFLAKNYPEIASSTGGPGKDVFVGVPSPQPNVVLPPVVPCVPVGPGGGLPAVGRPHRFPRPEAEAPQTPQPSTMSVSELMSSGFAFNDLLDFYRDSDDRRTDVWDRRSDNLWRDRDTEYWKGMEKHERKGTDDAAVDARRTLEETRRDDEMRRVMEDERRAADARRALDNRDAEATRRRADELAERARYDADRARYESELRSNAYRRDD